MENLNSPYKIYKKGIFERLCYVFTFILIFLSISYKNYRLIFYSYEVFYIMIMFFSAIKDNLKISKYTLWSAMFFVVCFISYIYASDQSIAFKQIFNLLKTLLICNSVLFFINGDSEKLDFILKSFVISTVFLSVLLVVKTPLFEWGSSRLGESVGLNSNDLGLKMSISFILSIYYSKKNKIYYPLSIIFFTISLLTGSRKAFLLNIFSITIFKILGTKKKKNLVLIIPLLLFLSFAAYQLIITIPDFYNVLGIRIELMINGFLGQGNVDSSTLNRLSMIDTGMILFKQKPLFGYGLFNYSALTPHEYSHNNYVELLVGVGIFGTVIYYSIYLMTLIKLLKSSRKNKYASLFISLIAGLALMEYGLVSYYEEIYQIIIVSGYCSTSLSKELIHGTNNNSRRFSTHRI